MMKNICDVSQTAPRKWASHALKGVPYSTVEALVPQVM